MTDFLTQNGISLSSSQIEKLDKFCDFLLTENQKFNLTAITDRQEVFEKHFADSILGSLLIPQNSTLCDVGSGAGFPSIPLCIAREDLKITTVDSLEKRTKFVSAAAKMLGLNLTCLHARVEDFARTDCRQTFDVVTARAVAPLNILLEYCVPLAKVGGIVLAYQTDDSQLELCKTAAKTLCVEVEKIANFVLPSSANRCLIAFKKFADTPNQYPRPLNKPRKNPL